MRKFNYYYTLKKNNKYLNSKNKYKTKIIEKDLPDYFFKYFKYNQYNFISVYNVVDLVYLPNYYIDTHLFKYDYLLVSYQRKIKRDKNNLLGYKNYDLILTDKEILYFIKKLDECSNYNFIGVKERINKKISWYEEQKRKIKYDIC